MGWEGFLEEMALEVGLERRCMTGVVRWREGNQGAEIAGCIQGTL